MFICFFLPFFGMNLSIQYSSQVQNEKLTSHPLPSVPCRFALDLASPNN